MAVLRGDAAAVRAFSKAVIAERGVTYGQVSFIPAVIETAAHAHRGESEAPAHVHAHPRT